MKPLLFCILPFVGAFVFSVLDSGSTEKHYILQANGQPARVKLNWDDIRSFGKVSGTINGEKVRGRNLRSGELKLEWEGVTIELRKSRSGNSFRWAGFGYDPSNCSNFEVVLIPCTLEESSKLLYSQETGDSNFNDFQPSGTFLAAGLSNL